MHLSSVTLINIRQFKDRTFEFQPGFNLLVGENGAGKTTILRGVLAALGNARRAGWRSMEDDDIRLHARHSEVTVRVRSSKSEVDEFHFRKSLFESPERSSSRMKRPVVLFYASNEATCSAMRVKRAKRVRKSNIDDFRRDEEFLYEMEKRMDFDQLKPDLGEPHFGNSQSVREFVERVISTFFRDLHDFYWRFEPYDCSLLPPEGAEIESPLDLDIKKHAREIAMRFFQEESPRWRKRPFSWPDKKKVILAPGSSESKRHDDRLPDLRRIWEDMRIPPKEREFLHSCSLEVKLTPRIMVRRKIGPLSLSQLSDGEQRLFSLFVDIARQLLVRNPGDNLGNGEAIVMIDEIDVHLHPKWQRKIVPALEDLFRGCQFIATTHSPFIVQATPPGRVQHIEGLPIGDVSDRGIEEIAKKAMGVEGETGVRYLEELEAAKKYLRALNATDPSTSDVKNLRKKLASLADRYARNPAYQAFLELKTDAKLGSEE